MKKLIVIAIAFFVIAGGIWLYSNSQRSRTYTSNSKVSFTDKGFNISDGEKALAGEYISGEKLNLGIAVYPGATLIDSKDAAQNLDIAGVKIQAATYETNDAREKVEKFYQNQIGSDATVVESNNASIIRRVVKSKNGIGPFASVWVEDGRTFFTLIRETKQAEK